MTLGYMSDDWPEVDLRAENSDLRARLEAALAGESAALEEVARLRGQCQAENSGPVQDCPCYVAAQRVTEARWRERVKAVRRMIMLPVDATANGIWKRLLDVDEALAILEAP